MTTDKNWPKIFPSLPDSNQIPTWTGKGFLIGEQLRPILSYENGSSGWTDDLTVFHEKTAGDSHFIDIASRCHAVSELKRNLSQKTPIILDIGCSSGFLLSDLKKSFPEAFIAGTDVVLGPLLHLSEGSSDIPLLHFDLTRCPLPDQSVDAVVLLNVLEHIENDSLAVKQIFRILKPGGVAVIEVPAGPEIYDIYDELLMHFRRYKISNLKEIFLKAGFKIRKQSHLGFFLYPGFFLVKKLRKSRRASIHTEEIQEAVREDIHQTGGNPMFNWLMKFELELGKFLRFPFGIRCLLTCYKPA